MASSPSDGPASAASRPDVNYWPDARCAKAFWSQRETPPYQRLFRDTVAWFDPAAGERWLDLGCGGGQLSRGLWLAAGGLEEVLGLDCAACNERAYEKLRRQLRPVPESPEMDRLVMNELRWDKNFAPKGHELFTREDYERMFEQ